MSRWFCSFDLIFQFGLSDVILLAVKFAIFINSSVFKPVIAMDIILASYLPLYQREPEFYRLLQSFMCYRFDFSWYQNCNVF